MYACVANVSKLKGLNIKVIGSSLITSNEIKSIIKVVNSSMSKTNKAIRQSIDHFRCLYFMQNRSWEGQGIVVEVNGNKVLLMIREFAIITQVKFKKKPKLDEKIKLKVSSIDLLERSVDFKPL